VAILIESLTDNRNRTAAELRLAFSKNGGNLGETGCVGYLFEHRSAVRIEQANLQEDALLEGLLTLEDQGGPAALGYELDDEGAEVFGAFESLEALQDGLRRLGWPVLSWEHRWIAQTPCRIEDPAGLASCLKLLDALEELDDVRSVTSNLEADEVLLQAVLG
jgi:transcriptional/translational regulatory protein YebC/TACO1